MLKYISIYAALVVLGTGAVNAQQQEAVLRKVELPGANYTIVVAMPKSPASATFDLRSQPDPTVAYIAGGTLVLGIDDKVATMFKDMRALLRPSCTFHADGLGSNSPQPVAVYIIPTGKPDIAWQQEEGPQGQTLPMFLSKMEPSGAEFDIVFGQTKSPSSGKLVFKYDNETNEIFPAIVPMLIPRCVTHVERSDGTADVIAIYVTPKETNLGPSMQ